MSATLSTSNRSAAKIAAKTTSALPILKPNAAGIDIAAEVIYVAVPEDRATPNVRSFGTFTRDLHAIGDWLRECGAESIALESTGVFWIPLFQILEARGFEVYLVNARHVKNVPGHKSDVADCRWLQYLHAVGLLRASFRPNQDVCAVRSILRHRDTLVTAAASEVQHMQKSLVQMNIQLHHVISDLTGKTGLTIVDAILSGERDPQVLAQLRDPRIKACLSDIVKALEGDWKDEHLFTLRQALHTYRHYQNLIAECDQEIEQRIPRFASAVDPEEHPLPPSTRPGKKPKGNAIRFEAKDLRVELHRIFGTDLTQVPGIDITTAHAIFTEVGADLSSFRTGKHFSSWLGLCPDNSVSGGKILSVKTRKVRNRTAKALRMAAQSLHHSQSALGEYYRRMRSRLGAPEAITATAHKLARIIYNLITTGKAYDETEFADSESAYQRRRLVRLTTEAAKLGYTLTPQS
jgi:transposase